MFQVQIYYPFIHDDRCTIEHGSISDIAVPSNPTTISSTPVSNQGIKKLNNSEPIFIKNMSKIKKIEDKLSSIPVDVMRLVVKCILECCCSVHHVTTSCMEDTLLGTFILEKQQPQIKKGRKRKHQSKYSSNSTQIPLVFLYSHLYRVEKVDPLHQPTPLDK